jgi:hypothetical protein
MSPTSRTLVAPQTDWGPRRAQSPLAHRAQQYINVNSGGAILYVKTAVSCLGPPPLRYLRCTRCPCSHSTHRPEWNEFGMLGATIQPSASALGGPGQPLLSGLHPLHTTAKPEDARRSAQSRACLRACFEDPTLSRVTFTTHKCPSSSKSKGAKRRERFKGHPHQIRSNFISRSHKVSKRN